VFKTTRSWNEGDFTSAHRGTKVMPELVMCPWWRDAQLYVEAEASMAAPAMAMAMLNVAAMR